MAQTPSHVRITPFANRQILTDLGLLVPRSYPEFIKKYPRLAASNYIVTREAQNSARTGAIGMYTKNKEFYQWQSKGKNAPSWKVAANVTAGGAGANFTVTVATGYYQASGGVAGVLSPPAPGHYYSNSATGQVYQVVSVNTTTPSAHTVVLRPTIASQTGEVLAAQTLVFEPTVVGEGSGSQETIIQIDERVANYCATIKSTKSFSDWNLFETIDIPNNPAGFDHFKPRQMYNEYDLFLFQQEKLLMFGKPFDNIAGVVNQHTGLIPNVIANGQSDTASTVVDAAFFTNLRRLIDAEGYSNEYDYLLSLELRMKVEAFLAATYTAGAIVYAKAFEGDSMEINQNFKAYDINGIKVNFMTYDYFSQAKMYGAPVNAGLYNNAGLLIPRGEGVNPEDGTNVPRFNIRWQGQSESDAPIRVRATGGLAPTPTDDTEKLVISHVTTKGLQAFGLNGYIWTKLNV